MSWRNLQQRIREARDGAGLTRDQVVERAVTTIPECPDDACRDTLRSYEEIRSTPPPDPRELVVYCSAMGMDAVTVAFEGGYLPGVRSPYAASDKESALRQLAGHLGLDVMMVNGGLLVRGFD